MYGKDDIQIKVDNIKRSPKMGDRKKTLEKMTRELVTDKRTLCSRLNYYD